MLYNNTNDAHSHPYTYTQCRMGEEAQLLKSLEIVIDNNITHSMERESWGKLLRDRVERIIMRFSECTVSKHFFYAQSTVMVISGRRMLQ